MIFATVGTQLPFDRLIGALDTLAENLGEPILAQTGPSDGAGTRWPNLDCRVTMEPCAFDAAFAEARVIVAHAGVGTLLSARRHDKPLIILPRRHALGEHRNDHQLATARQVVNMPGISVAWQAEDLGALLTGPTPPAPGVTASSTSAMLIARLRAFVEA